MTATIDQGLCMCCGVCVSACPEQAISLGISAVIDSSRCTGCGACVDECPNEAISLS